VWSPYRAVSVPANKKSAHMQIFLSHSSKQKPLVREIKSHLPTHLNSWIDEERLLFGDEITSSIEAAIKVETDYVLLFIDDHAAVSEWVRSELKWTLQAEASQNRTILLPIVLDRAALDKLGNSSIHSRKYLTIADFHHNSVLKLAEAISQELFALVCRDVSRLAHPPVLTNKEILAGAERLVASQAAVLQKVVFPHRRDNPISREKLLEVVHAYDPTLIPADSLDEVIELVASRGLVPGLHYDGYEAFVTEEHAKWKPALFHDAKVRVARKAASMVRNGMKLFLDAGSTTEEVVRLLCRQVESRSIMNLTVATTSVNIADMISDCCVKMGFDDDFSAVRLFIPGGRIRPSTQAVVPELSEMADQIRLLSDKLGGFDLAFVGVNGIDTDHGFTTQDNAEARNKQDILASAQNTVIVADSSKVGLRLDICFADFSNEHLSLLVNDDPDNVHLRGLIERHHDRVIVV
jgi:DeoR/GlpR family transcriptional regulator of sugar metabolism